MDYSEKALPHVVTALIAKRSALVGLIDNLQASLRQAVVDLDNVEATLRIFAPDLSLPGNKGRAAAPVATATKGETARIILGALRAATKPLTTGEITEAVMCERNLDCQNAALFRMMAKRVGACLRAWQTEKGSVRSMPGPGQQHLWQLGPALQ